MIMNEILGVNNELHRNTGLRVDSPFKLVLDEAMDGPVTRQTM
jgi:hypothetical protein